MAHLLELKEEGVVTDAVTVFHMALLVKLEAMESIQCFYFWAQKLFTTK